MTDYNPDVKEENVPSQGDENSVTSDSVNHEKKTDGTEKISVHSTKQKKKKRFSVGLLIISLGLVLILVGVGYEVINYPWGYSNDSTNLKDPKPLSENYTFYYGSSNTNDASLSALPAQNSNLPLSRPYVDLEFMGYLKIPRIGLSENIVEGDQDELLYAVGHVPGTAEAGQVGNFVLSGHRNYIYMHPFKYLNKMQVGDTVIVETADMRYTYELYDILTVKPDETWVVEPQEGEEKMITLITCTPVPSYTERLICWGRLVSEEPLLPEEVQ